MGRFDLNSLKIHETSSDVNVKIVKFYADQESGIIFENIEKGSTIVWNLGKSFFC